LLDLELRVIKMKQKKGTKQIGKKLKDSGNFLKAVEPVFENQL
jgi:hypothetical protein